MKRKTLFWILFLLVAVASFVSALMPKPAEVDVAEVTRGPFSVTVNEDGETRVRELYLVSAPLAGRLERIGLESGDPVKRDQIVAEIAPVEPSLLDARSEAEALARVNAADAALERARSQVEIAQAEEERARRYVERDTLRLKQGAISPPVLEDTEHSLRVARGSLAAAESSVEVAKFESEQAHAALQYSKSLGDEAGELRRFTIRSPIDGVVLRRHQESSTVLAAGEPIFELGDPARLEVRIDVLSQDAVRIRQGQRISIEHWGGKEELTAWVRRVDPSAFTKVSALGVEEKRVWVYADFASPPPDWDKGIQDTGDFVDSREVRPVVGTLGDAYRVEGRIVVYEREDVVRVPSGALFREGSGEDAGWAVFRIDGRNRAKKVAVVIGERNDVSVEIESGLDPGDRVVLHPGDKVREGVALREREG